MIFRRLTLALAAAACLAAAAGMLVVALGYALFSLLRDTTGPAGASACVAALAAIIAAAAGWILANSAHLGSGPRRRGGPKGAAPVSLGDNLVDLVRDRPVAAAALATAVGWVLTRSPGLAGALNALISRQGRDRRY